MSPPQKNVKDQRFFPFRRGHARPAEVNRRQPRDCKGRDVWLEVNGNYKGSKADSERYQVSTRRPWFLSEESKSEPWAALLRSTVGGNTDWTPNSQPLPPLPAFPSQESLPDPESTVPPEVFTVGSKTFSWTPFPPALRGSGSSCRLLRCPEGSPGSPAPSLKGCPALDSRQTPSTQECVQSQLVLLNCPLCQKAFDPKLTQLDVDSHLAQCLAESTEDVVW